MNAFSKALLAGTIATAFTGMTDAALARYLDPSQVDLVRILAPPPAPQSPEGKAELEAVLAVPADENRYRCQAGPGRRRTLGVPLRRCHGRSIFAAEPAVRDGVL